MQAQPWAPEQALAQAAEEGLGDPTLCQKLALRAVSGSVSRPSSHCSLRSDSERQRIRPSRLAHCEFLGSARRAHEIHSRRSITSVAFGGATRQG